MVYSVFPLLGFIMSSNLQFLKESFFSPKNNIPGLLALALMTLAIYYPAIKAGIIWDDKANFVADPLMTAENGLQRIWLNPRENNEIWPYLPISRTSFWLERQAWGINFSRSHLLNIILHGMGGIILWLSLKQFQIRGAWWVGLLFVSHPIFVQSVAWLTERKNVLAGVFYLLTIWSYLHFDKKKQWGWYGLTLGLFLCALLSKSSTIMLPVIFIFCRLWFRQIWKKSDYLSLIPFFLLSSLNAYSRIWFELHSFGANSTEYARSFLERLLTAGHIPFFYLKKILFPHPLIFIYPRWQIDPGQVTQYIPLFSLLLIAGMLFWKYRRWGSPLFLGLGAFLAALFPVLGFFNNAWTSNAFVADHWVHLPSISILILLVQGVIIGWEKSAMKGGDKTGILLVCFGGIPLILGGLTWSQTQVYQDLETLSRDTISKNPNAAAAYLDLGTVHAGREEHQLAIQYYQQAMRLNPNNAEVYNNQGISYLGLKQHQKAIESLKYAIALKEESEYYSNLGGIYIYLKEYEKALENFNKAIELDSSNPKPYSNRLQIYLLLQQHDKALADLNKLIALAPNTIQYYLLRSKIYGDIKQYQKALDELTAIIENYPSFEGIPSIYFFMGNFHIELRQYEDAIEDYTHAARLGHQTAALYNNRGFAYRTLHQDDKAIADLSQAIQIDPGFTRSYHHRGAIYREQNNKKMACSDWKKACELKVCQDYLLAQKNGDC